LPGGDRARRVTGPAARGSRVLAAGQILGAFVSRTGGRGELRGVDGLKSFDFSGSPFGRGGRE
jgi:hypothetical protein